MSKASVVWLRWRWPREGMGSEAAQASMRAVQSLSAAGRDRAVLLEVVTTGSGVEHRLRTSEAHATHLAPRLSQAAPGVSIDWIEDVPEPSSVRAGAIRLSTGRRPLATDQAEQVTGGLLAALADVGDGEEVLLQWWLGRPLTPITLPSPAHVPEESGLARLASILTGGLRTLDGASRRALLDKQGRPGWRVAGRLGVNEAARRRGRFEAVAAALRAVNAPGVQLRVQSTGAAPVTRRRPPRRWPMLVNVDELVVLGALPVGEAPALSIPRSSHRFLPLDRAVASSGSVLGHGTHPRSQRPAALDPRARLRHLHILGPTGVGKSTLMLNLITQDLQAGRGVVVIEPKGDLITAVLERVPARRTRDLAVLDPTDTDQPVGLNPLQLGEGSRELAVDHLVAAFKGLFASSWGPRTQDLLTAGLLTLVRHRGATLADLLPLFTDPATRGRYLHDLDDPLALQPFWSWFDALSDRERASVLAPLMNKLRTFLLRDTVRSVVAQPGPRLDLSALLARGGVLLVDLSRGRVGPEAAGLLGSLVFASLWQTLRQGSAASPLAIYIDEFQDYLHLPTDTGEMLAQSRSLGVGLTLAHQHLGQLPAELRNGVLANAHSRIAFQLGYDDAHTLARGHRELVPEDFMGLGAFEAYAQLSAEGTARPFASIRTAEAPPPSSDARELRAISRERYGVPLAELHAAWRPDDPTPQASIGSAPRRGGRS